MSTEDQNKAGLVSSQPSSLSRSGTMSLILIRRGTQDLLAKEEAEEWSKRGLELSAHGRHEEAASWYRKAADQGDADGQFMLAVMYQKGRGVPHDPEQAISWFRKSADQGDEGAQIVLGGIYEAGKIVPQDYPQAAYWYLNVVSVFDYFEVVQRRLGHMYENGLGVPKDLDQAAHWYRKAAEQGDEPAKAALATLRMAKMSELSNPKPTESESTGS